MSSKEPQRRFGRVCRGSVRTLGVTCDSVIFGRARLDTSRTVASLWKNTRCYPLPTPRESPPFASSRLPATPPLGPSVGTGGTRLRKALVGVAAGVRRRS